MKIKNYILYVLIIILAVGQLSSFYLFYELKGDLSGVYGNIANGLSELKDRIDRIEYNDVVILATIRDKNITITGFPLDPSICKQFEDKELV